MMSLIWPSMLFSLILVPLFGIAYLLMQKRRVKVAEQFISIGNEHQKGKKRSQIPRHLSTVLYLSSLAVLLFALARPQATVNFPRLEGTTILAFDVSGSMAADDISPTRMEAAKNAAERFVQQMPGTVLVGVVAFCDSGFSVQSPTNNQDDILAAISRLSPQQGTSLGQGIITSLRAIASEHDVNSNEQISQIENDLASAFNLVEEGVFESTIIILLSDGENNMEPDPLEAAWTAADYGVRIYTVGIGSAVGTTINIDGFTVHSQLDEIVLQEISGISNGAYFNAQNDEDLHEVFGELPHMLRVRPENIEVTSIFTGISIFLMLTGAIFSMIWFRRLP